MSSGVRPVQLNVYDLHESNSWLQHIGLGAYHSGLEIGGVEYTFSEAGVAQHPPRQIAGDGVSFKTTEVLGDFIGTMPDVRRILNGLKAEGFAEGEYDVIRNNCNHFCDELAFALTGKRIPPWVNRAATIATWAGLGESKKEGANDKKGGAGTAASSATASAPPSRDRKELTQKQRDLLSKMRTNKSSGGGGRGGAGGAK
ncbi:conserved unknown protein [Ectocarpus siliculosus]|uniref:PPPDE domain-containing protein n=1 Tax=Ectocarpus siliculosus TaxID=2880 RepID=D8LRA3_ECTSI|nr:conserved unknown protein [Ectocarpus siliculosus]|eukprot:CBN75008.1 conserved unknown protein [Ectocarpus siliculosus]